MISLKMFLLLAMGRSPVFAQDLKRFEFQPFAGFTVSGKIPIETEDNITGSVEVNSSYHTGASFNIYF